MSTLRERLGSLPAAPVPPVHLGLYWRPSRETDSWRIRELIHLTEQHSHPARPTSEDEITRLTKALSHPELQDCLIGLDSRGNLAAFGSVTLQPDEKPMPAPTYSRSLPSIGEDAESAEPYLPGKMCGLEN